ncbi:MAG: DUF4097 family beta strand repeat-containing protein [Acidobacteriota bacterium]
MKSCGNKLIRVAISLCLLSGVTAAVFGQDKPKEEKSKETKPAKAASPVMPLPDRVGPMLPGFRRMRQNDGETTEKSIAVDPSASIRICVLNGRLRINGWERDEVRVFVKNGSRIGVRVLEKSEDSGKPVWLLISNLAAAPPAAGQMSECISGDTIEMDVPVKSSLTISGRTTQTMVDSVRKVFVKNVEGNISLRNISGGITAATYQGDVSVENSSGAISLESGTGNIVAYEVNPGGIGDLFKAKTNSGAISMQKVQHRQIESNSITGSVLFSGKFLSGGLYNFKTSNGSIRLLVPKDTSCTITASYGFGEFNSAVPLKYLYNNKIERAKNLGAVIGSGDSTVKLTTSSGSIAINYQ